MCCFSHCSERYKVLIYCFYSHFVFAFAFVVMFVEYNGCLCGPESLHTIWKTEIAQPDKFRFSSVLSFSVLDWTEWIQLGKCSWGGNLVFSERRTNVVTIQERSLTIFKIKPENRRALRRKMLFCWHGDDRVSTENQSGPIFLLTIKALDANQLLHLRSKPWINSSANLRWWAAQECVPGCL